MRRVILSSALAILAMIEFSCEHNTPNSPEEAGLGYFPMKVGNHWIYESAIPQSDWAFELKIVGTTHISGKKYFIFEKRNLDSGFVDSTLYRADEDGKIHIYKEGQERLYIDFALAAGESWPSYLGYTGEISQKNGSREVPAGAFENCVGVFFDAPDSVDEELNNIYAPGVGLIETSGFRFVLQLKSAVVNGVEFP